MMFKKIQIIYFFLYLVASLSTVKAQEAGISAEDFGRIPEISQVKISPVGSRLATLQRNNGEKILVIRSLTDPSVAPIAIPFEEGEFNWVRWLSPDRILTGVRYYSMFKRHNGVRHATRQKIEFTSTRMVSIKWDGSEAKKVIKYVEFDEADAFLSKEKDRIQYLSEIEKFLEKYL